MILKNKKILVTGGNRGLGIEIAKAYSKAGAKVIITGRDEKALLSAVEKTSMDYAVCDLMSQDSIYKLVETLEDVDILVNCAGVFPVGTLEETSLQDYEECMQVNVTAPFILMKEFAPKMADKGWGRIVNIASSSAYGGSPKTSIYCAAKHALLGLSRSLFKELKGSGVRVVCVSPGTIKTNMGREVEKLGQEYDTFMEPKEIAEYVVYNTALNGHMVSEEIRLNRMFIQ